MRINATAEVHPVTPNISNTSAFVLGSLVGFGETHAVLCASDAINGQYIASAGSLGLLYEVYRECMEVGGDCGDVFVIYVVATMYQLEGFLVGLPSECQIAESVKSKIGHVRSKADMLAMALTGIEQRHRLQKVATLYQQGFPFCSGYQLSVALQRLIEEPMMMANQSANDTTGEVLKGFLDGLLLPVQADTQCGATFRFIMPVVLKNLDTLSSNFIHSVKTIVSLLSAWALHCNWGMDPQGFYGGASTPKIHINVTTVEEALKEHKSEVAAASSLAFLSMRNAQWRRMGEEFGKIVGIATNIKMV